MATSDINLAERSGNLVESHKGYDPRIIFFYFVLAALLGVLAVGLGYQQLRKTGEYADAERQQNQRRIILPGPRGNIYDRHGRLLVGNNHRFAVRLYLDELKPELLGEFRRIRNNYRDTGDKDIPDATQLRRIARVSVVQRYLDQVNAITGRAEQVNARRLESHFARQLLLPYLLVDSLAPEEYARLLEKLPVRSPLELYASSLRAYPHGSAAAHTLGYVREQEEAELDDFPGDDLTTFKMKGTVGMDGLEKWFDARLQGEAGGRIYRVDPAGFKINPPLAERKPKQGQHLVTSLDIDLQLAAEQAIGEQTGAAVALDVNTGEVLVLASKPDFDLNKFSPRATTEMVADMNERGAWVNHTVNGFYPPGSTFKILTSIAGLRANALSPDNAIVNCNRHYLVGNRLYPCDVGNGHHGEVLLRDAISVSCDIYYYKAGELITPAAIAAEGRRFRLEQRTGIELPNERHGSIMPDPQWKLRERKAKWMPGDTANVSIGQGDVLVSPLQMACFVASVARGEVATRPTLLHHATPIQQRSESIGLTPAQRAAIIDGMAGAITHPKGTGRNLLLPAYRIPGITIAGKTGTAQLRVTKNGKTGNINVAWFICFAPVEQPEIALAVMVVGDTIGEDFYASLNAVPVAGVVLKKHFAKKHAPAAKPIPKVFKAD